MGQAGMRKAASALVLRRRVLIVLACVAGLFALGLTLAALVEPQELQAVTEIIRGGPAQTSVNWTQFGFDASGTRNNSTETRIKATNVAGLHLAWRSQLPDIADSTPAFLSAPAFPDGAVHNVLYLTTKSGSLVALDADSGSLLWTRSNPTFDPNKITTSSPFADAASDVVYSYGLDGKVHKYDAITGRELYGRGWPETVTTMRNTEKESSALTAANGFLYVSQLGRRCPSVPGAHGRDRPGQRHDPRIQCALFRPHTSARSRRVP
jgi:outer membrane protein assembly factor BamB